MMSTSTSFGINALFRPVTLLFVLLMLTNGTSASETQKNIDDMFAGLQGGTHSDEFLAPETGAPRPISELVQRIQGCFPGRLFGRTRGAPREEPVAETSEQETAEASQVSKPYPDTFTDRVEAFHKDLAKKYGDQEEPLDEASKQESVDETASEGPALPEYNFDHDGARPGLDQPPVTPIAGLGIVLLYVVLLVIVPYCIYLIGKKFQSWFGHVFSNSG